MASLDALGNIQSAYAISGENILTVTHELGHVFGSPHTHNCSWPAGPDWTLAPIDKCATVEGDCNISEIIPQDRNNYELLPDKYSNLWHIGKQSDKSQGRSETWFWRSAWSALLLEK